MTRKKKTSIQNWVGLLDDFCRSAVKIKAKFICEHCGEAGIQVGGMRIIHWAHLEGRGKRETRWGFTMKDGSYCYNAFALCGGCHMWFDNAENRGETQDWLECKLGRAKWMELKERARRTKSWGVKDFEAKLAELENIG